MGNCDGKYLDTVNFGVMLGKYHIPVSGRNDLLVFM